MTSGAHLSKYLVWFNTLASRVEWGDMVLCFQFYDGLPDQLKDQITLLGKPNTLQELAMGREWKSRGGEGAFGLLRLTHHPSKHIKFRHPHIQQSAQATMDIALPPIALAPSPLLLLS